EHRNSNVIELYDGRVYDIDSIKDPTRHNCKGRPTTKRMKGRNEENNNASTSKVQKENMRNDCENINNRQKCSNDVKVQKEGLVIQIVSVLEAKKRVII
ncbi:hypothetical protein RhiirA1_481192, partial [Rhizophagus irregularis]